MTDHEETQQHVDALIAEHDQIERQIRALRETQRSLDEHIDADHLSMRPTFPTPGQITGIAEAARRVYAREKPQSHQGDPTAPGAPPKSYDVVVDGSRGFIRLRTQSPYSRRRLDRLWTYTAPEIIAIIAECEKHGLLVRDHWISDGLSMLYEVDPLHPASS